MPAHAKAGSEATWVEPVIEAEVAYSTVTKNNLLREAVFKGLREDRELPPARTRTRTPVLTPGDRTESGVQRENILQLLPDAVSPSKEALAAYWRKLWKRALPHLGRRPLKLVRHVRGTTFYHKGKLPPGSGGRAQAHHREARRRRRHAALGR